jgi:cyanophycinase
MRSSKPKKIGRLFLIGGAEDPDESNMTLLPQFVKLCGGRRARIVVCGSPSSEPDKKERTYHRLFQKLGVKTVMETQITSRQDAQSDETVDAVRRATGVFFTGGDQLRLTSLIAGTRFGDCVSGRLWREGLIVGGTSAGAAAMSSTMLIGGAERGTVRRDDVKLAPGLGYWRETTVDTHFAQRGRVSRLLVVFSENPHVLGIGLDENTAINVEPGVKFAVSGEGACFVFDGAVTHSSAPEVGDDKVIAMTDSIVHVLPSGYGFDLKTMRPILPNGRRVPKRT